MCILCWWTWNEIVVGSSTPSGGMALSSHSAGSVAPLQVCAGSYLSPNFTCWRENPYDFWEIQFSITLYRESGCCVLETVFGGFLQIS